MNILQSLEDTCEMGAQVAKQASGPSLLDNLKRKHADASERLADLNAAIHALEKNPEVAKVLELVARAR